METNFFTLAISCCIVSSQCDRETGEWCFLYWDRVGVEFQISKELERKENFVFRNLCRSQFPSLRSSSIIFCPDPQSIPVISFHVNHVTSVWSHSENKVLRN